MFLKRKFRSDLRNLSHGGGLRATTVVLEEFHAFKREWVWRIVVPRRAPRLALRASRFALRAAPVARRPAPVMRARSAAIGTGEPVQASREGPFQKRQFVGYCPTRLAVGHAARSLSKGWAPRQP